MDIKQQRVRGGLLRSNFFITQKLAVLKYNVFCCIINNVYMEKSGKFKII